MAVTSLLTSMESFDGAPTFVSNATRYGGGSGATTNNDIVRQGTQSAGRRADNTATGGFGVTVTSTDLSADNQHVKAWFFVTQWSQLNSVSLVIASGSAGTAGDLHTLPTAEFPVNGGFIPFWVDVSRTADSGGPATESAIIEIGVQVNIGDVGGNAQNIILDQIHYGTSGLRWTGASGDIDEFRTYETTNDIGVLVSQNGVDFVYARLEIGSATSTTFTDSGFTVIFPNQLLVSSTFMGLTFDLQHASTAVTLSNGTIQSSNVAGATNRPDFIVTGTSGALTLNTVSLLGMRTVDLTSGCTINGGIIETLNLTQNGATIGAGVTIRPNTASGVAMLDDANFTELTDATFVQAGSGHAILIGTAGTYTLDTLFFFGFGADGTNSAAIYNNSGGLVTLNITGGGDSPTVRNGAGASTTINNSVLLTIDAPVSLVGAEIRIYDLDNSPAGSFGTELSGTESNGTATYAYTGTAGNLIHIQIMLSGYVEFNRAFTMPTAAQTYTAQLVVDNND